MEEFVGHRVKFGKIAFHGKWASRVGTITELTSYWGLPGVVFKDEKTGEELLVSSPDLLDTMELLPEVGDLIRVTQTYPDEPETVTIRQGILGYMIKDAKDNRCYKTAKDVYLGKEDDSDFTVDILQKGPIRPAIGAKVKYTQSEILSNGTEINSVRTGVIHNYDEDGFGFDSFAYLLFTPEHPEDTVIVEGE